MRDAISVTGLPVGENGDEGFFARVGGTWRMGGWRNNEASKVTRITVTEDLPGLHCNMERVRVYVGETVVWEGPLHNLEGVAYPLPPEVEG